MRFRAEIYKSVAGGSSNDGGAIPVDNLNNLLVNIGRADKLLTESEMMSLLQDADAATGRCISKQDVMQLVS